MQPTMTGINTDTICPGCFAPKGQANPCPHCGYDERAERSPLLLPHRTLLNGQFVVGRVLGKPGGFGITYLGWDLNLETRVALKEYLPRDLAGRAGDRASVASHSREDGDLFRYGLEQFLREARTLAQPDHPNIVRVRQFFEANGTAYLVMDYHQGLSLGDHPETLDFFPNAGVRPRNKSRPETPSSHMHRALKNSLAATALTGLSLYLWRTAYISSDWAVLALIPLALPIAVGFWPLTRDPWMARLHLALRKDSPLGKVLTGSIRAAVLSATFTFVAVTLLAWQALSASVTASAIMLAAFFLSAWIFSAGQHLLLRHFHQPFARSMATSLVSWMVAVPFTVIIALTIWAWAAMPGAMLDADFLGAVQIGLEKVPERGGWISDILAFPYGYEAVKLWVVVQLRDYPLFGALFSLDAALLSFVLCRSAIVITQFIEANIMKEQE